MRLDKCIQSENPHHDYQGDLCTLWYNFLSFLFPNRVAGLASWVVVCDCAKGTCTGSPPVSHRYSITCVRFRWDEATLDLRICKTNETAVCAPAPNIQWWGRQGGTALDVPKGENVSHRTRLLYSHSGTSSVGSVCDFVSRPLWPHFRIPA